MWDYCWTKRFNVCKCVFTGDVLRSAWGIAADCSGAPSVGEMWRSTSSVVLCVHSFTYISHISGVFLTSFSQFLTVFPWRIHGAGIYIYANIGGYIDGIHGTPYIAAPWILWICACFFFRVAQFCKSIESNGQVNQFDRDAFCLQGPWPIPDLRIFIGTIGTASSMSTEDET